MKFTGVAASVALLVASVATAAGAAAQVKDRAPGEVAYGAPGAASVAGLVAAFEYSAAPLGGEYSRDSFAASELTQKEFTLK